MDGVKIRKIYPRSNERGKYEVSYFHHRIDCSNNNSRMCVIRINYIKNDPYAYIYGVNPVKFPLYLKELEFRYNNRHYDIYDAVLKSISEYSLGASIQ